MTPLGLGAADDELGRTAADVDDEERPGVRPVELGGGAGEGEPALLARRVSSSGRGAEDLGDGGEEVVAVGGVAAGRGGDDAHALGAVALELGA